jgi:dipeptidyl aminopeptidase/acylaminoacyl peptidase
MMKASGGSPAQITKGAGPDESMGLSRDGAKLLYRQEQFIGHIWIASAEGGNARQITFDDAYLWRVSFSPDGKKVLFGFSSPIGSAEGYSVCSIDRDGRNRKQLTLGGESVSNPMMSPDGRWIIYGRHSLSTPHDSSMVYVLDANILGTPRLVGKGHPLRWVDEKRFISYDIPTCRSWLCSIDGGEPEKFFEDSTYAIPLQGGRYIGYYDLRPGSEGVWICAAPGTTDPALPFPKRLLPHGANLEFDKQGKFCYWVENAGELRRASIPSGKQEIIRGAFPGLTVNYSWFDISHDGREIVYTDARASTKFVMIENLFK